MATDVTTFGGTTVSEAYRVCLVRGRWYFYPNDNDWLAFHGNDDFSTGHATETEALDAAECWEAMNDDAGDDDE